jgi:CHAT domain-containing protein
MTPGLAILEYVVATSATYVLLLKQGLDRPLVWEACDESGSLPRRALELCVARLLIDFHGLPPNWDLSPNPRLREARDLPPAVAAAKRNKAVLERNLGNTNFHYEMDYWTRLGTKLFPAPLRPHLKECHLLCLIPHGPLHGLPFAALPWTKDQFLIERFGLCHAPSLSVLRFCRSRNPRRGSRPGAPSASALVAAIAAQDDEDPALFEGDAAWLASICEAQSVGSTRVVPLVGAKPTGAARPASRAAILDEAPAHELIHLACHGVFGGDQQGDPLDSGLLVSDGETVLSLTDAATMTPRERRQWIISARDLFALHLRADLVTLRACSSGRSQVEAGDELLGLMRAVLYAGAASLIVALWNVHKKSSQLLLSTFYQAWLRHEAGEPVPKWRALQQAQLAVFQAGYAHPFHWAPFVLVGDWL